MSVNPMHKPPEGYVVNPGIFNNEKAQQCLMPMG